MAVTRNALPGGLRPLLFILCALPLGHAAWRAYTGQVADAADYLTRQSGWWALALLLTTLAIRPLVKLAHWPALIQTRRMLGLYSFAYACVHLALYLLLSGADPAIIADDIRKSPYIVAGFAAWLLLLPLALTSTKRWMQRLKRNWGRLHRLVYPAAILACLHFWWLGKSGTSDAALFSALLAGLLLWRVLRLRAAA